MIKDSLKYTKNYCNLSQKIKLGLEYLSNNNLKDVENGKYNIDGEDVFINIQDYYTKPQNQGKWEAHRKYIDIQFMISGYEKVGVGPIDDFIKSETYNELKDLEFFQTDKALQFVEIKENDFLILFPNDVHMPQISIKESSYVKKAVLKIAV